MSYLGAEVPFTTNDISKPIIALQATRALRVTGQIPRKARRNLDDKYTRSTGRLLAPRLTVRCEYPDGSSPPSEVTFRPSPSYGLLTAREAHDQFLSMMREREEFVVETDRAGELPVSFWSEAI